MSAAVLEILVAAPLTCRTMWTILSSMPQAGTVSAQGAAQGLLSWAQPPPNKYQEIMMHLACRSHEGPGADCLPGKVCSSQG